MADIRHDAEVIAPRHGVGRDSEAGLEFQNGTWSETLHLYGLKEAIPIGLDLVVLGKVDAHDKWSSWPGARIAHRCSRITALPLGGRSVARVSG
jgi:hypothetical protein